MRRLTYIGRVSRRVFTPEDGVSARLVFIRGEPLMVGDNDAQRILDVAGAQFHAEAPSTPGLSRPSTGHTTPTKEGSDGTR